MQQTLVLVKPDGVRKNLIGENIVHGSDSEESAAREINNFFKPEEIY